MNTICNFPDIDVYLLLFLDLKNIIVLSLISKNQNTLISDLDYIKELYKLRHNHPTSYNYGVRNYDSKRMYIGCNCIIDMAAKYNYMVLIRHIHNSVTKFEYTYLTIHYATQYGNIEVLQWFDKYGYEFIYKAW